jgi:uncharacterized protein YrzB (UPF0473 family)
MDYETKELEKRRKILKTMIDQKIREKVFKILKELKHKEFVDDAVSLDEITKKVTGKQYVSRKDKQYVYQFIREFRNEGNDLIVLNRRYGFGNEDETVRYYSGRARVINGSIIGLTKMTASSYKRLGIDFKPQLFIENKQK